MNDIKNAIQVHDLKKSYGKKAVLKGVNFSIPRGSIFCLLGSNGAGKTTIVHILTTLLDADGGEATICGYDVCKQAGEIRRRISLTGQYAAVDELLTAEENMLMTAKLFHVQNSKERVTNLLRRFGLSDVSNKKVSTFSGGMRRRLDIAMSLTGNPEVLFLDEPTTGLDPQNRIEMWNAVKELAKSGVTIFLTTQILEEAEQLADTIAILHEGNIIREGTPEELKTIISESKIILYFGKTDDLTKAKEELFLKYKVDCNLEALALTLTTDGTIDSLTDILKSVSNQNILSVEQKKASLEDVFLKLIGHRED